jgi:hypothetical protein
VMSLGHANGHQPTKQDDTAQSSRVHRCASVKM